MTLPDDFDEFLDYETEVFDRLEEKYSSEIRQRTEERYKSQVPDDDLEKQVRWLESKFYSFIDEFYIEKTGNKTLDSVYSSVLPQTWDSKKVPHDRLNWVESFEQYDAIVLDHCVVFDILTKSDRQYYYEGKNVQDWEETLDVIHEATEASKLYVPSDLVEKTNKSGYLGNNEPAKLFTEGFETIDMNAEIDLPGNHEHLEEDLIIGSKSEKLGENVLILTYDSDFDSAVEHHFDIEAAAPIK